MAKVVLDQDKCIGCGLCVAEAPDNFEFEAATSTLISETVNPEVENAVNGCPVEAISIEE